MFLSPGGAAHWTLEYTRGAARRAPLAYIIVGVVVTVVAMAVVAVAVVTAAVRGEERTTSWCGRPMLRHATMKG